MFKFKESDIRVYVPDHYQYCLYNNILSMLIIQWVSISGLCGMSLFSSLIISLENHPHYPILHGTRLIVMFFFPSLGTYDNVLTSSSLLDYLIFEDSWGINPMRTFLTAS